MVYFFLHWFYNKIIKTYFVYGQKNSKNKSIEKYSVMVKDNKNSYCHLYMPENHMHSLYYSKNPLVRWVHQKRLSYIVSHLPKKNGLKILDAGCGEGHLIKKMYLNNKFNDYYGVDITEIAIQKAKKRCPYANIKKMDISKLSYNENFFDVIVCSDVIEHIIDYQSAINKLIRSLKKGGYLIITFPNETLWTLGRLILIRRPIKIPDHINSFTPYQIKKIVKMKLDEQVNLPFKLPFFLSLGCLMKFIKE